MKTLETRNKKPMREREGKGKKLEKKRNCEENKDSKQFDRRDFFPEKDEKKGKM